MIHSSMSPSMDLEGFKRVVFDYEADDDIAFIHFDAPRAAITEEVDDGWYLRLTDDTVVGMEMHGLRRVFLSQPQFASVFEPAVRELELRAGRPLEAGIVIEGEINDLPRTTHLSIFLVGQGLARLEAIRRRGFEASASEIQMSGN